MNTESHGTGSHGTSSDGTVGDDTSSHQEREFEVRRALLALCVLDEVDVLPTGAGVQLGLGSNHLVLPWASAIAVLGDHSASSDAARPRLRSWLALHDSVRSGRTLGVADLRVLALAPGSALHPGPAWVRASVLGGALDLGFGVVGHTAREEGAVPLWPDVAVATGYVAERADDAWRRGRRHLDVMAGIAVRRLRRDLQQAEADDVVDLVGVFGGNTTGPNSAVRCGPLLRPVGGCDVPTLLASPAVRSWIAGQDPTGLGAVAVPTRTRGWTDVAHTDPAFVAAAWTATEAAERGLPRAVLVSAEEVSLLPSAR